MAGKQVLRIKTRERLRLGNARHVAGPGARPDGVSGGRAGHSARRGGLRHGAQGSARPPAPHGAQALQGEFVLAGPPPYDGIGREPWAPERERAHASHAWVRSILGPESLVAAAGWHRDEVAPMCTC